DPDPEMVDGPAGDVAVVDRLGAVAVRVEEERAVVVVAVLRARTGWAVVPVARLRPDAPELVDLRARAGIEADVEAARHRMLAGRRGEREILPLGEVLVAVRPLAADRPQHGLVEPLRRLTVGHAD